MNREIKFEYGFESVNGIVKKNYAISEIPSIQEKCDVWNVLQIKYVRQYTGLKDKKGKEIYEGDIVRNEDGDLRTIIYWQNSFEMRCINGERGSGGTIWYFTTEVIGNIYENPELL